ncbi:MAG TPA: ATP-binding protein [Mycobacteriales bacterium]
MGDGFRSTSLWQSTLAPRAHDGGATEREYLRIAFERLRESTGVLLGELGASMDSYTVHDISHADALWETAGMVLGPEIVLNPAEAFVLGAAFLFHDAAMGLAAYPDGIEKGLGEERWRDLLCGTFRDRVGRWPLDHELTDPPDDVVAAAASAAIRESHARQAATLIREPRRTPAGETYHLFDDAMLRDWYGRTIGMLAESHWWGVETLPGRFRHLLNPPPRLHGWTVDPLTLACALRLADATQVDARRAPTMLLALRRPDADSLKHWRFQQFVGQPRLDGDRVTYTSARPFDRTEAAAWWLALDYLRDVDEELRRVDDLLHDLRRPRLAARGVAGVGAPERFAEHFETTGWRPLDADVHISDVRSLVTALGGEQLYGRQPEIAVRELIQNAQDAVVARQHLEPDVTTIPVEVSLAETSEGWTLTVRDSGVGMDEEVLVRGLMDFGSSGWRSGMVRRKFPGLMSSGFRPRGHFGIGFFSVFMLGDRVEVTSRRYDLGMADARRLTFDGLANRPLVVPAPEGERVPPGTTVRVHLKVHPYDREGLIGGTDVWRLFELVQRIAPESDVAFRVAEPGQPSRVLGTFALATATAQEVFDRLYPASVEDSNVAREHRRSLRAEFAESATEVLDEEGRRIGLAVAGAHLLTWRPPDIHGVTIVNGFRADRLDFFCGYLLARPRRASRDDADILAPDPALGRWLAEQAALLRETGRSTPTRQLFLTQLLIKAGVPVDDDHYVGLTRAGAVRRGELGPWVSQRDEVFLLWGWPLTWRVGGNDGAVVSHFPSNQDVRLPDGWLSTVNWWYETPFERIFTDRRDEDFESARFHTRNSWQRLWWSISDEIDGLVIADIARQWSCTVEDLLAPGERTQWGDTASFVLPDGRREEAQVLRLRRPGRDQGPGRTGVRTGSD